MEDMNLMANLFVASSKLRLASSWLEKMANGDEPDDAGKDTLFWAGKFLCQLDWTSSLSQNGQISRGLGIEATSIRPAFYSSLMRIAPQLKIIGIDTETKLLDFLSNFYTYLLSNENKELNKKLDTGYSNIGSILLNEIAQTIFIQLNNNGLPKISISLKNAWKPSSNEFYNQASASI